MTGAGAALGTLVAAGLRRRPDELRAWRTGLQVLASEIGYGAVPLPEALRRAGAAAGGAAGAALAAAGARLAAGEGAEPEGAWHAAVAQAQAASPLADEDCAALAAVAPVLGRTGREDQLRHLQLAVRRLEAAEAAAREAAAREARLWAYACTCGALVVALVLA
ncbi:MAG: stage III sporulation protein AB [Firmicutes bacterium]|nr:stage III sporulation protein AB [Bacillota bacterium]